MMGRVKGQRDARMGGSVQESELNGGGGGWVDQVCTGWIGD